MMNIPTVSIAERFASSLRRTGSEAEVWGPRTLLTDADEHRIRAAAHVLKVTTQLGKVGDQVFVEILKEVD